MQSWVTKGVEREEACNNLYVIKLKRMRCLECNQAFEVSNLRLARGARFQNMACVDCKAATNSNGVEV